MITWRREGCHLWIIIICFVSTSSSSSIPQYCNSSSLIVSGADDIEHLKTCNAFNNIVIFLTSETDQVSFNSETIRGNMTIVFQGKSTVIFPALKKVQGNVHICAEQNLGTSPSAIFSNINQVVGTFKIGESLDGDKNVEELCRGMAGYLDVTVNSNGDQHIVIDGPLIIRRGRTIDINHLGLVCNPTNVECQLQHAFQIELPQITSTIKINADSTVMDHPLIVGGSVALIRNPDSDPYQKKSNARRDIRIHSLGLVLSNQDNISFLKDACTLDSGSKVVIYGTNADGVTFQGGLESQCEDTDDVTDLDNVQSVESLTGRWHINSKSYQPKKGVTMSTCNGYGILDSDLKESCQCFHQCQKTTTCQPIYNSYMYTIVSSHLIVSKDSPWFPTSDQNCALLLEENEAFYSIKKTSITTHVCYYQVTNDQGEAALVSSPVLCSSRPPAHWFEVGSKPITNTFYWTLIQEMSTVLPLSFDLTFLSFCYDDTIQDVILCDGNRTTPTIPSTTTPMTSITTTIATTETPISGTDSSSTSPSTTTTVKNDHSVTHPEPTTTAPTSTSTSTSSSSSMSPISWSVLGVSLFVVSLVFLFLFIKRYRKYALYKRIEHETMELDLPAPPKLEVMPDDARYEEIDQHFLRFYEILTSFRDNLPMLEYHLQQKDPSIRNEDGMNMLQFACTQCLPALTEAQLMTICLFMPNYLEVPDAFGQTPLFYLVRAEAVSLIRVLVIQGANVNSTDCQGLTPVIIACQMTNPQLVAMLLSLGADPNIQDAKGWDAFFWAVACGSSLTVQALLHHVGDEFSSSDHIDHQGRTLSDVCDKSEPEILQLLQHFETKFTP